MHFEEAERYIWNRPKFSRKLGLHRVEYILKHFSNPHQKLQIIHVAGTNGKGRTYEYALASGYGEFMERFQNRILLEPSFIHQIHQILHQENSSLCSALRGIGIRSEFIFDPHERFEKTAIAIKEIKDNDVLLFSNKPEDNKKIENLVLQNLSNADSIMIPFYSVTDDKEIFLPVELCYCASGSNGMCAGNSYQEAFLQGICEIFAKT